jgi:hypothetical protein
MARIMVAREDIQDPQTGELVALAGETFVESEWPDILKRIGWLGLNPASVLNTYIVRRGERYGPISMEAPRVD